MIRPNIYIAMQYLSNKKVTKVYHFICFKISLQQPYLCEKFQIHDTCGVNNLHGMPGIISGLLSVLFSWIASELIYGPSLYMIFSNAAPSKDDDGEWTRVHEMLDTIEVGVKSNKKLC